MQLNSAEYWQQLQRVMEQYVADERTVRLAAAHARRQKHIDDLKRRCGVTTPEKS